MTLLYKTTVDGAGPLAESFLEEGMFVTFGQVAPAELAEFCYLVAPAPADDIAAGDTLIVDGREYPITAIGTTAAKALDELGHITVRFDAAESAGQSGSMHAYGPTPRLRIGSVIEVRR